MTQKECKTIGIDCRFAATRSGLGRYTRELVSHLLKRQDPLSYVLFVRSTQEDWLSPLKESSMHYSLLFEPEPQSRGQTTNYRHYSFSEQLLFPRQLKKANIDLLFTPHFNVPIFCPVPFIVTIHDLILHRFPNQASLFRRLGYRFLMHSVVRKAKHIVSPSNFTAQELASLYGLTLREKVVVIPEGVSSLFSLRPPEEQHSVRSRYGIEKPFFLYVGNAKEHKNVQTLIDAFHRLHREDRELVLVTAGKEVSRLHLGGNVRLLPELPDVELAALYSSALAFVTASLYEGFCLPIVEASACGCPVIASKAGAIPEVAGEGALLVEPTVEALARAMESPPTKQMPQAVSVSSWEKAAEQTTILLLREPVS